MAYREFQYEKQYEAPDLSQANATQAQAISNLFRSIQQRQEARRTAAAQFDYDLDQGAFENDTKILTEVAKNVTGRARNELRSLGKLSLETEELMKNGTGWQQLSKNQLKRAEELRANIKDRASQDEFYNPQEDLNLIKQATHGENNDVDFRTRGDRLASAEKSVGGINTFLFDKYRAKYVKDIGTQLKEREFPLKSGASKTIYDQATFWDSTGKPGVTDQHAIRFLESEPRVAQYYDDRVARELDAEIKAMKSSGDTRAEWMKGLKDEEIKNALINDPSKNIINSKDYGVRVRDKARFDLEEADRINSKVSYTGLQNDLNNSGGRWKNPNILHEDATNSFAQAAKSEDTGQMGTVVTYGPGGRFTQKSGKAVQIDITNPIRTDTKRGITTRNNKGSIKLNMTGYQLMPVKKGMAPFALKSSNPDGMIEEIQKIPLEYFDPAGKTGLQPEMRIGLNGYTVNEAGVLNDIQDQLFDLSSQIHEAQSKGDKEKLQSLQNLEYNLNDLKEMIGSGDYDPQDLLLAGNKAGVRKIQQEWLIPADDSDMATIKNVTGGFNLKDKSFWSPEMQAVDDAYRKRAKEAKAQGYGKQGQSPDEKKDVSLKSSYNVNGKDYTLDDIKKMGYTDDQIKEAVRLGNLK